MERKGASSSSLYGRILDSDVPWFLSLPFTFFGFPSFIGFPLGSVGKSFSISSESFIRQNEIGARREGVAENEERAVNHAGKVEAVERAKDEMDRQVTKGKGKEREVEIAG